MKQITFFLLSIFCLTSLQAQPKRFVDHERRVPASPVNSLVIPSRPANILTASWPSYPELVGHTVYDMQSNASVQNRLYLYPDGMMAGIWTKGMNSAESFPDLGTGYNTSDGDNWGTPPGGRIENERCGSPTYAPLGTTGELIVSHTDASGLNIAMRPVRGQGQWIQTILPGPAEAPAIAWPRAITSRAGFTSIHILAVTSSSYAGLEKALLYYRSTDGGQTWDKTHVILPGMDSINYTGFSADEYAWGTAHGDTIYFAIGGPYIDTFIMKSNDNGDTWTKIPILSNGNKKFQTPPVYVAPWRSSDGSLAVEMDHSGIIHFASGIGGGYISEGLKYIRTGLNGLIYWKTTMPMLADSLNLDTLDARNQLLHYYSDGPNPGDTLRVVPDYRVGLTSMPEITVDNNNNIFVIWSGITGENPFIDSINYRHIFGRAWWNDYSKWCETHDYSEGVVYMFQEYVYPSMAKSENFDRLQVLYQTRQLPGSAVLQPELFFQDCNMEYRELNKDDLFLFCIFGAAPDLTNFSTQISQNYPNPARDKTSFEVTLAETSRVSVEVHDVLNRPLIFIDNGKTTSGRHVITIDISRLTPGIYFYIVNIGNERHVKRMIVE
jgi:hypothetical protein